jgi:hypothetical protein
MPGRNPRIPRPSEGKSDEAKGRQMTWRTLGVAVAAVLTAATATPPAAATPAPQWQVTLLPMPAGWPDATAYVWGSDGHGGYAGTITTDTDVVVVTWNCGKVAVHTGPNGSGWTDVKGESRDGTVLVNTATLDRAGVYHPVSPGPFRYAGPVAIGPRGDLVGLGDEPDLSKVDALYWSSPSAEPVALAGMLPSSYPVAIDDNGTVLFNHPDGPYLLRDGVVHKLALPAGYSHGSAYGIRHGVVTGSASPPDGPSGAALVWHSPDSPAVLANSGNHALYRNSRGLSVGTEFDPLSSWGPTAAWQGGRELGRLPGLDGLPIVHSSIVDDDGTIAGVGSIYVGGAEGRPALWRLVTG